MHPVQLLMYANSFKWGCDIVGYLPKLVMMIAPLLSGVVPFSSSFFGGKGPLETQPGKKGALLALSAQSESLSRWVLGAEPPGPRCLSMEG